VVTAGSGEAHAPRCYRRTTCAAENPEVLPPGPVSDGRCPKVHAGDVLPAVARGPRLDVRAPRRACGRHDGEDLDILTWDSAGSAAKRPFNLKVVC
jgi:hypothetical protein